MKTILLVDDDEISIFIITKLLESSGLAREIHAVGNGQVALDLIASTFGGTSFLPDLILLDLNMPVMDGFRFLEAFKKLRLPNKENVKIIIVTSSEDPCDLWRAKEMGISGYLTKPLSREALLQVLNY